MYTVGGFGLPFYGVGSISLVLSGITLFAFRKTVDNTDYNPPRSTAMETSCSKIDPNKKAITAKEAFTVRNR